VPTPSLRRVPGESGKGMGKAWRPGWLTFVGALTFVASWVSILTAPMTDVAKLACAAGVLLVTAVVLAYVAGRYLASRELPLRGLGRIRRADLEKMFPLAELIINASKDVYFVGLSLPTLYDYSDLLLERARNDIDIRLLVVNPEKVVLVRMIAMFLGRQLEYPAELQLFFRSWLGSRRKVPGRIHVRVHEQIPTVSATVIDGRTAQIEVLMYRWSTGDRPIFVVDLGLESQLRQSLEQLWDSATELKTDADFIRLEEAAAKLVRASRPGGMPERRQNT